jgi:hypothetical protein
MGIKQRVLTEKYNLQKAEEELFLSNLQDYSIEYSELFIDSIHYISKEIEFMEYNKIKGILTVYFQPILSEHFEDWKIENFIKANVELYLNLTIIQTNHTPAGTTNHIKTSYNLF